MRTETAQLWWAHTAHPAEKPAVNTAISPQLVLCGIRQQMDDQNTGNNQPKADHSRQIQSLTKDDEPNASDKQDPQTGPDCINHADRHKFQRYTALTRKPEIFRV